MRRLTALALIAGLSVLAGCSPSAAVQTDLADQGRKFLLAEEPPGAVSILDFREAGAGAADVVLFGRVGGAKPPWSPHAAEFMISDPTHITAEDDHVCHSDNCPFCKGKQQQNDALAIVLLTDEAGRVPAVAARRLLPLDEGQLVVVRGQAEVNSIGQLVVRATGLYVRR